MKKGKSLTEILGMLDKGTRISVVYELAGQVEIPRQYLEEAINSCKKEEPEIAIEIAKAGGLQDIAEKIYHQKMKQYCREKDYFSAEILAKAYGRPEDAINICVKHKEYCQAALIAHNAGLKDSWNKYRKMAGVDKIIDEVIDGKWRHKRT